MERENWIKKYNKINNSYRKVYVFHLGAEAGFYSEFCNMVSAILYCLKNKYKFVLYSTDANFAYRKGWDDYFQPFCQESTFFVHKKFNKRINRPKLLRMDRFFFKLYKFIFKNTHFTYELWNRYYCKDFDSEFFDIPELEIKGDLLSASSKIVQMIYRFNKNTLKVIEDYKNQLLIPEQYISMQIRRGDKITECQFCPVDDYFDVAQKYLKNNSLFLLTDDYSIINEICEGYKNWNIYTLTNLSERGYIHGDFVKLNKYEKQQQIIKLFASIEIIRDSSIFIGTYTTNIGLFLGMYMGVKNIFSVQKKNWFRFDNTDVLEVLAK